MKFIHMADTHLGRTGFHKVDPDTGENLRAKMIYDNFLTNMDHIISLDPDFIVHSGDLFDMVKPQNRAFVVAAEGLRRLSDAGIPMYCIAGNHSMNKTRYTSSPFNVLEYSSHGSEFVYQFKPVTIEHGDCDIHLIPNMHHKDDYVSAFRELNPNPRGFNVLVMHGLCTGIKNKRLNTMAEIEIGEDITNSTDYQYVALGHYHNQEAIAPHIWYSGSMEHLTYGEIYDEKGALMVDCSSGSVAPVEGLVKTPMIPGVPLNCGELSPAEITDHILKQIDKSPAGSMVQITLKDIGPEKGSALDHTKINEVAEKLVHLKLKREDKRENSPVISTAEDIRSINYLDEFDAYVKSLGVSASEMAKISTKGHEIIKKVFS